MELAHSQVSEILSNYTSSSEGVPFSLSLIMNSLMRHERDSFVSEDGHEQCNGFEFPSLVQSWPWVFSPYPNAAAVAISIWFFQAWSVARAKNVQGLSNLLYTKGLTAGQTGEISEDIYGRDYSRQQVSCLTWVRRIADARVHGS